MQEFSECQVRQAEQDLAEVYPGWNYHQKITLDLNPKATNGKNADGVSHAVCKRKERTAARISVCASLLCFVLADIGVETSYDPILSRQIHVLR